MLTLADVIEASTGTRPEGASQVISEASIDSRKIIPASLFVALPGEHADGHDFVGEAFQRGAHFALVQRDLSGQFPTLDVRKGDDWLEKVKSLKTPGCILVPDSLKALQDTARLWRCKLNVKVIGITGSVGKSTSKETIAGVLSQRYHTLKSPGNLNNEIGLPLTLLRLGHGHERAVLEMGFYVPGEIAFLCELALPQIGVITNIGLVHAERAGSQEAIAHGKAELVKALPPAPDGVAILNYDDPWVRPMAAETKAQVFYYGLSSEANLWADNIEGLGLEGIRFRLHYHNEVIHLRVPMIGRHSVHTALRAAAVGLVDGLSWQEIVSGLQQGHAQLRLVAVHTENGALLLDD
ncbi:MAG: UDP-N-acetylmuramoyl-tripeptide--D-alanyl-D-alanine ligase, partial [Chloroflexi bacterium]|nr:UDP-N-acetylmuramoyl-tripeptide--D-alanyl-D-alanine ligase [Chloroflexota bacterium]